MIQKKKKIGRGGGKKKTKTKAFSIWNIFLLSVFIARLKGFEFGLDREETEEKEFYKHKMPKMREKCTQINS